jgi:hypothetical protein
MIRIALLANFPLFLPRGGNARPVKSTPIPAVAASRLLTNGQAIA